MAAWTSPPRTWVPLETPTEVTFNTHVRDQFRALVEDRPRCILTKSASQSIPSAVLTNVTYDTEILDLPNNDMHSTVTATDQILITTAGLYRVIFNGRMDGAAGTFRQFLIYKNAAQLAEHVGPVGPYVGSSVSALTRCVVGDILTTRVFQDSGAALSFGIVPAIVQFAAIWETT
jgi:hypothetical protein